MLVQQHLLNALEDLVDDEFDKFKWYLSLKVLDDCEPIKKSHLQNISRNNTVSAMIRTYKEDSAVRLTLKILREMNFNSTAADLEKALAAERTASPSASSPAVAPSAEAPGAPAAPATMMAQQGGVISALTITGSSITNMNMVIHKDS